MRYSLKCNCSGIARETSWPWIQGCSQIYFQVNLYFGSFFNNPETNVLNSLLHPVAYGVGEFIAKLAISWEVAAMKGGFPWESSYIIHPAAQRSLWKEYTPPSTKS